MGARLLSSFVAAAFLLVPGLARADALTEALTIQPINVCADAAMTICAVDPTNVAAYQAFFQNLQTGLGAGWAQAGIAPVLLPPENQFIQSQNVGLATEVGLTTGVDTTQPIDGFRLLTRTPGNGQSPNENTINLYFVNILNTPGSSNINRAVSYVNGNGIVVSTVNEVLDTTFHELGHNLGLDHTTFGNQNQPPDDLLSAGGIRTIPATIGDITPNGANLDQLNTTQAARAQQPLFTVNLGRATVTPLTGESCPFGTCFNASYLGPPPSTTETLNSIVFKYAPDDEFSPNGFELLDETGIAPGDVSSSFTTISTPSGLVDQLTISFAPGAFGQGDAIDFSTFFEDPQVPSDPVSVIFNFQDGFASQAGFDQVTGADSGNPINGLFSFVGTPNYYVPGTCPNNDCTMLPPLFGSPATFEVAEVDVSVPEPSSFAVLGAGLTWLWVVRRRLSGRRWYFTGTS
jgi:hypothetical protein